MLDDNVTQTLTIIVPILAAIFGMAYFLMKQINAAERRLNERIDAVERRLDRRIDEVERSTREEFGKVYEEFRRVYEEFGNVHEDIARVREDLAEVKGKVDLMAAIVTKSENERMAEAIIALETRRASARSE